MGLKLVDLDSGVSGMLRCQIQKGAFIQDMLFKIM